jgi:predicted outer membrane repeat protein
MKKITLVLLAVVCSMSLFSTRYLVQTGAPESTSWRAATEGEVLVDLTANSQTLNEWMAATFASFPEGDEIWMAAGTYTVTAVFNIPANFTLYGGFAGTETSADQRDKGENAWDYSNETIIDGNNATAIFGCASNRVALYDGITLTQGTITGNSGAIMARPGVVVRNSKFINNTASGQGGAILMNGGGEVYDSYFEGNAANLGGAVHMGGTGASIVSGCLFENNKAIVGTNRQGGALRSQSTDARIENSIFINNEATGNGSAIYTQVDAVGANKIINCVLRDNKSKSALYLRGAVVINSTVVNNEAGGVYIATKDAQIYNTVFWADTRTAAAVSGVNAVGIEYSNNASVNIPSNDQWVSINNIQLDTLSTENNYPHFADAANNNWQLTQQSPLLNAGSIVADAPLTDILGVARPQGSAYDIGAYELEYLTTSTADQPDGLRIRTSANTLLARGIAPGQYITIYSMTGATLYHQKATSTEVSVPLSQGIYVVKIGTTATKVIIN